MRVIPKDFKQDELGLIINGFFVEEREITSESRFFSNVERAVELRGETNCPLCQANDDPDEIPLHPGCDCDVVTVAIERGVPPVDKAFKDAVDTRSVVYLSQTDAPVGIRLDPISASAIPMRNIRYADVMHWLGSAPVSSWDYVAVFHDSTEDGSRMVLALAGRFDGPGVVKDMFLVPSAEATPDVMKRIFDQIRREANDAKDSTGTSNDDGGSGSPE